MSDDHLHALAVYDEAFDVVSRSFPTMLDVEAYLVRLVGRLGTGPTFACWRRSKCRCPTVLSTDGQREIDCRCSDAHETEVVVNSAGPGSNCAYILDLRLASPIGRWPKNYCLRLFALDESGDELPIIDMDRSRTVAHGQPALSFRTLDVTLDDRVLVLRFDYMSFTQRKSGRK